MAAFQRHAAASLLTGSTACTLRSSGCLSAGWGNCLLTVCGTLGLLCIQPADSIRCGASPSDEIPSKSMGPLEKYTSLLLWTDRRSAPQQEGQVRRENKTGIFQNKGLIFNGVLCTSGRIRWKRQKSGRMKQRISIAAEDEKSPRSGKVTPHLLQLPNVPHHHLSLTHHVLHTELVGHGVVDHELHLTNGSLDPLEVWKKGKQCRI